MLYQTTLLLFFLATTVHGAPTYKPQGPDDKYAKPATIPDDHPAVERAVKWASPFIDQLAEGTIDMPTLKKETKGVGAP